MTPFAFLNPVLPLLSENERSTDASFTSKQRAEGVKGVTFATKDVKFADSLLSFTSTYPDF